MNISEHAQSLVSEVIRYRGIENLLENSQDWAVQYADDICIYFSDCHDYIAELESDFGDCYEDSGQEFKAENWREAMQAFAYQLVYAALCSEIETITDNVGDDIQAFNAKVLFLGGDTEKAKIGSECAYGWAAHNYETDSGVMVWSDETDNPNGAFNPEWLEGELLAVSMRLITGNYLNVCFAPVIENH